MDPEALLAAISVAQQAADPLTELMRSQMVEDDALLDRSWDSVIEARLLLRVLIDVGVALLLAASIAFHPRRHGRAVDIDEVQYPKTVLLYAVVGTIVAEIVVVSPAMALVVFGIGGLLRFRTEVGEAHETGHVILATLVGITCGLGRFPLAVVATAVGWLLIWTLERGTLYRLVVAEVDRRAIERSIARYQDLLQREGWSIRGIKREPGKQRFSIYVRGKSEPIRTPIEDRLPDTPTELRGEPYWEEL